MTTGCPQTCHMHERGLTMISNRYSLRPLAIAIVLSGLVSAPAGAETGEQYTRSLVD